MDMIFGYKNCPNIALNFFNFLDYLPKVIFLIEQIFNVLFCVKTVLTLKIQRIVSFYTKSMVRITKVEK